MKNRAFAWALLVVLATMLLHGWIVSSHFPAPNFLKYPLAARQYNSGILDKERLADFSPFYFYLHAAAQKWLPRPEQAILWLQVLLTALASGLLFRLFWLHFGPCLAVAGTGAFILDRAIMIYEHVLEPESLLLFFLLAFAYCCAGSSPVRHFLGGFFLALALLCRLNFLPLAALAPWYFFLRRERLADWLKSGIFLVLPVLLALGFLSLRNHRLQGTFSPLTMNPGTVFFEGNNPNSLGQSSIYPPLVYDLADEFPGQPDSQHVLYRLVARRDRGENLSIAAVNRFWSGKAMNFIRDHPWRFLRLLGAKANFFFHGYRRHDLANAFWDDRELDEKKIPSFPLALVSALAILGIFLARKNWRHHLLFYGLLFSQLAVLLLTYVSARQRVAVYPAFIFFALLAVQRLLAGKNKLRLIPAVAAVIVLTLLLGTENDGMKEETHQWENFQQSRNFYRQALAQRETGRWRDASLSAMQAMAAAPWLGDSLRPANLAFEPWGYEAGALFIHESKATGDFSSLFDRAVLSLEAGQLDKAEKIFNGLQEQGRSFKRDYDQSSQPLFYLARIALKKGNSIQAWAMLSKARLLAPGDPSVLAYLYVLSGKPEYENTLIRYFDKLDAEFFIGKAFLETGRPERAAFFLSRLCRIIPVYRRGQICLAASLAGSGDWEGGAKIYFREHAGRQDPVFLEKEILAAFRKWSESPAASAQAHFFYGQALRLFGHYAKALEAQKQALLLAPGHALIKREIQRLGELKESYLRAD